MLFSTHVPIPGISYPKAKGRGKRITIDFIDVDTEIFIGSIEIEVETDRDLPERLTAEALSVSDETGCTVFAVSETGDECVVHPIHHRQPV
jgi:hypothetical protein